MNVTQHFTIEEFACHDGTPYPIGTTDDEDPAGRTWLGARLLPLCQTLEVIRAEGGGASIAIDSGYRTEAYDARLYNAHMAALAAAGLPNDHKVAEPTSSEHPRGRASDIRHATLSPVALFNLILSLYESGKLPHLGGIGLYPNFVHVDVRKRPGSGDAPTSGHLAIWGGSRPTNVA